MKNKEKTFISAVIYLHNNEKEIVESLNSIYEALQNNFMDFEIICVNDASTDNTLKKIKEFCINKGSVMISVINMSFYQGLESSMHAGIDLVIGDFVYEFDNVDKLITEKIIMDLYKTSVKGYDIVSASPKKTKLSSKIFYKIFNTFSHIDGAIGTETIRIISRRAINRVHSLSKTIPYRKAVYANCGLKTISMKYDLLNNSKVSKKERIQLATDSIILFTNIAYRITIVITCLMMLLTIFSAAYTVITYLLSKPIAGWTTTMLFLSLAFFGLFMILTIIVKYLSIILDMIFKKQNYIIESIEKINKI